ncbi:glutathione S-transferase LANCL1 isoform X2 [Ochotona princeps]|nr:glutathione S-transferase LANCL1 isoform X2 [Ochotona princeps]XP_058520934.1 glutathione S-transferase LANCL1 isoform X2 [Ochotona princeps]XP_058520936.1 glutathione S-transferase LANCL1 isoform X2 [Ochotona princeps]
MAQRAFPNPYADYNKSLAEGYFDSAGRLMPEFSQRLTNKIRELLQQMERGLKSADPRDGTAYTGWAGIAVLYLHLYDVFGDPAYLQMAHGYVKQSLNCLTKRSITFLCGDAGPLAVAAVLYHKMNNEKQAEDCIARLIHLNKIDPHAPSEMLYGRMGYIYALLFVNKNFGEEKIPRSHIQQICETVLTSGENLARKRNFTGKTPLMYEWYQEYYVGAAHGLAGIYYYLMQPSLQVSQGKLHNLVKPSVDYVCQLKFPSGNYPPCVGDSRDLLVHWCHGAPGVIYMLIQAYKVFKEEQYLIDAYQCTDVIWQYGLLKKGYGLCHGAAGNAYAFLTLYNLTQDMKCLYRACKEWLEQFISWLICWSPRKPNSLHLNFERKACLLQLKHDRLGCAFKPGCMLLCFSSKHKIKSVLGWYFLSKLIFSSVSYFGICIYLKVSVRKSFNFCFLLKKGCAVFGGHTHLFHGLEKIKFIIVTICYSSKNVLERNC